MSSFLSSIPWPNLASFPSSSTILTALSALTVILPLSVAGFLYFYQTSLIYPAHFPPRSREEVDTPDKYGIKYENVELVTTDGERLKAFLLLHQDDNQAYGNDKAVDGKNSKLPQGTRPTILYLHANAGNMGHRLPIAQAFMNLLKCNVFMLSYRGYGHSSGNPSEEGIRIDAQTALDFLLYTSAYSNISPSTSSSEDYVFEEARRKGNRKAPSSTHPNGHPAIRDTEVIVFGQSIGGAVAIDLVARNKRWVKQCGADSSYSKEGNRSIDEGRIKALILENTFLSLPSLIPHVLPLLSPFAFLCHQIWHSENLIRQIQQSLPILFLSSVKDELVPREHMKKLFVESGGEWPKGKEGEMRFEKENASDDPKFGSASTAQDSMGMTRVERGKNDLSKLDTTQSVVIGGINGTRLFVSFPEGMHNNACLQAGYFESVKVFWDRCVVECSNDPISND